MLVKTATIYSRTSMARIGWDHKNKFQSKVILAIQGSDRRSLKIENENNSMKT